MDIRASSIPLSGYNGATLVDIGDPGGGRLFRPILADWKEADGMIKSLLIGGSLALAPLSSIMAADITFTVTNEQTSGSTYTADMLVQHASGVTELVPFIATAIGQCQWFNAYLCSVQFFRAARNCHRWRYCQRGVMRVYFAS
ncbi:hypothetical protein OS176_12925 [Xanthomonadaceae bacterium XH05]|nr:hypothetical protein [Xanthomonadaceae bacterium XH05]